MSQKNKHFMLIPQEDGAPLSMTEIYREMKARKEVLLDKLSGSNADGVLMDLANKSDLSVLSRDLSQDTETLLNELNKKGKEPSEGYLVLTGDDHAEHQEKPTLPNAYQIYLNKMRSKK